MAGYEKLRSIFHQYNENIAREVLEKRRTSDSTLCWDFPVKDEKLFAVVTPELLALTEEIGKREVQLTSLWAQLSGGAQVHMLRHLLISEAAATNAIENIHSTRQELDETLFHLEKKQSSTNRRFVKMLNYFYELSKGTLELPKSPQELRELYDSFFDGEIAQEDMPDGQLFRVKSVTITDGIKESIHRGFETETAIISGVNTALLLMNAQTGPILLQAIMAHYMFEAVHPFYDGNGRLGRFLLIQGVSTVLSTPTAFALSTAINKEKSKYYKAFIEVQHKLNYGDGTPFVITMCSLLLSAQEQLHQELLLRINQIKTLSDKITELGNSNMIPNAKSRLYNLLYILGQVELFGWESGEEQITLAKNLEVTEQTLRKDLKRLEGLGLIKKVKNRPVTVKLTANGRELLGLD